MNPILLLGLIASTVAANGVIPVKFDILRGTSFDTAIKDVKRSERLFNRPPLYKRADDVKEYPITDESWYYAARITIDGTEFETMIDTGSSDLWVYGTDNPYCQTTKKMAKRSDLESKGRKFEPDVDAILQRPTDSRLVKRNPEAQPIPAEAASEAGSGRTATYSGSSPRATIDCAKYGTLDRSSSSFKGNGSFFFIQYGDLTYATGEWGTDDVTFGGFTIDNLMFAVANQSNATVTVLGVGLEGNEASKSSFMDRYPGGAFTYPNLPVAMKNQGLISKVGYSLYMDSDSAEGVVLFGGIDHAKYEGELVTLPLLNYYKDQGVDTPITFDVELNSLSITGDSSTVKLLDESISVLLDSGTTLNHLPRNTIINMARSLRAQYSSRLGRYYVDCPSSKTGITLDFKFGDVTIKVPIEDMLAPIDTSYTYCALMVQPDQRYILGDTFLRHAYAVFDLENLEVQLAQYKSTNSVDIRNFNGDSVSVSSAAASSTSSSASSTGSSASSTRSSSSTSSTDSSVSNTYNTDDSYSSYSYPSYTYSSYSYPSYSYSSYSYSSYSYSRYSYSSYSYSSYSYSTYTDPSIPFVQVGGGGYGEGTSNGSSSLSTTTGSQPVGGGVGVGGNAANVKTLSLPLVIIAGILFLL
ncbi:CYFA0S21e01376g1_1 [Cyberlindnera fabianii]|uniref:CYFA0S21e01376g1_1 n=1 Tax=Cyberlindnera fabianii TaxID=36022 RepID=A0A061B804_CYBFA|nr:CYFA0S21e01376g1_1 [Cyberlindnera fabianii]